jgi:O-methyltransferase
MGSEIVGGLVQEVGDETHGAGHREMKLRTLEAALRERLPGPVIRALSTVKGLTTGTRQLAIVDAPLTYNRDGLATIHRCDFLSDPRFREAYARGLETGSWGRADPAWRAYVCCWAAEKGAGLPGDFVECGVNRGGLASAVAAYVGFERLEKTFYLLDTFNGFVERYLTPTERKLARTSDREFEECYDFVARRFAHFQNVRIVRGPVPDTLQLVSSQQVAYLSIDMNCVQPEIAAAEYFWDRLVSGAVIVLDDYGWVTFEEQKTAFDKFARERGVHVLAMPTGQGLIFKP